MERTRKFQTTDDAVLAGLLAEVGPEQLLEAISRRLQDQAARLAGNRDIEAAGRVRMAAEAIMLPVDAGWLR